MVNIRSVNDVILNLIDYFKLVQPNLDTKPGTVARDLFIDAPATQIALAYEELSSVSSLQSISLASGADLDKLASNFGLSRKSAIKSNGTALVTFSSVDAPLAINVGDIISTSGGVAFKVTYGLSISPSNSNFYRSTAVKFQNDLDFLGITDQYAAQVLVEAVAAGSAGNINKYSLSKITSAGVSNVTNVNSFSGGVDQEGDAAFRNRILSIFNGNGVGTALGYRSTALSISSVIDAVVIEPGNPLMTRDGTVVKINADGTRTIVSEGNGGKVDVIVLGQSISPYIDTYIFQNKSNSSNIVDDRNNIVLGQIAADQNKTLNKRRVDDIKAGTLPAQPVDAITSVVGSLSGPNFKPKSIDSYGRVSGNYELVKDTGEYSGSPWGFDYFKWISNKILNYSQDITKGKFNGQDNLSYTDITNIPLIQQNISITNENSTVTNDRSIIQLLHYPVSNVTRVTNVNTGERYLITNQNVDGTGGVNYTGRIKISGNTLPTPTDVLQVDYSWIFSYDPYTDYDGKYLNNNVRPSNDSVDWGYSSIIKNEKILFKLSGNFFAGDTSHLINSVAKCNLFNQVDGKVYKKTSGKYVDRYAVEITKLLPAQKISTIENIYLKNTYTEVYQTAENNGIYFNSLYVIGNSNVYKCEIILPTDTYAKEDDYVTIIFNSVDVYTTENGNGDFNINTITIPASNIDLPNNSEVYLNVFYIANVQTLFSKSVNSLPASRCFNGYLLSNNIGFANKYEQNLLRKENHIVITNVNTQLCIELDISANNFILNENDIIAIIRIKDNLILWDQQNKGNPPVVNIQNNNVYQLIFPTGTLAAANDQVIVFYYAKDSINYQPFSFINYPLKYNLLNVDQDANKNKFVKLIDFVSNTIPLKFSLIDPATLTEYVSLTDGYITSLFDGYQAILTNEDGYDYSSILNINNLKIRVEDEYNFNNNGLFDIINFTPNTSSFTIGLNLSNLLNSQISAVRIFDGLDVWNDSGVLDVENNKLILINNNLNIGDTLFVNYFNFDNLRQSPTSISSNISDQLVNPGTIAVQGTTITKIEDVVFTCSSGSNALKINLAEAITSKLGSKSLNNLKLARVVKLEKVNTVSSNNNEVLSTIVSYDVLGGQLKNNLYYSNEFVNNKNLTDLEFVLPSTIKNTTNTYENPYLPKTGDKLRATVYVINYSDQESVSYTSSGTLYTNKKFVLINKIYVASGFKTTQSSVVSLNTVTQPSIGARYTTFYDYLAPKTNERITINYNYNKTITDVTFAIENNRPINADVIAKQAEKLLVDVTMNIVVTEANINNSAIVAQNVKDKLITSINLNKLGGVIDGSDLVNDAYLVSGVDRVRIIYFNFNGVVGQALSLTAQENQYFSANNVIVNIENR